MEQGSAQTACSEECGQDEIWEVRHIGAPKEVVIFDLWNEARRLRWTRYGSQIDPCKPLRRFPHH